MSSQMRPKVSIVAISYNHERYIKQAFDSFLAQKTNFDFEIIVGDDHSTDNTPNIIKQYAAKHPNIFKPIIRSKNIGIQKNFSDSINKARGEYIALCECDDYWTDPNKLQAQVDFMDKHPQDSLCFHPVSVFYQDKKTQSEVFPDKQRFSKFDTEELLKENFIQTNSVMYRSHGSIEIPENILPVDWYLHLYYAQFGDIGFIDKTMSAYRRHTGGVWWAENDTEFWQKNGSGQINMYQAAFDLYKSKPAYVKALLEPVGQAMTAISKLKVGKEDPLLEVVTSHPELTANFIRHEYDVQTKHRQDFDTLTKLNNNHIDKLEAVIKEQAEVIKELRKKRDALINSKPYRIAHRVGIVGGQVKKVSMSKIRKVAKTIFPPGSKRRIIAGRTKQVLLHGPRSNYFVYKNWIRKIEPTTLSPVLNEQKITVSVVVPCYNTPEKYIKELTQSLINQTYTNWQLCVADGSTSESASEVIESYCDQDERIVYKKIGKNLNISGNTNVALDLATGSYIAFLDHDDVLPAWSLNELVTSINENPNADIFYSDEDRITENGKNRMSPLFKPDWSPELFFTANYVSHFFVIKADLMKKLKGLRSEFNGSQDYDLMLRALDEKPNIFHIPKILYHMRMSASSTASSISVKDYAHDSGNRALTDYFSRNHINAEVLAMDDRPTNHRIKYLIQTPPLVSIIIPFKDKATVLKTCVDSILKKTNHNNYEIILVSNNSTEEKTFSYLRSLKNNKKIRQLTYDKPFNFSAINNFARKNAKGKVLVFLNNDTEVITKEWLEELSSVALQKEIGSVGALLLYPDKTIQHAGVVLGMLGTAGHVFRKLKLGTLTPFWLPDWPRDYLAVTAACVAIEASKFDAAGGFDEHFITAGSDVRLGLALHENGYRNVYWPYAQLIHYENVSVGAYNKRDDNQHDYEESMKYYRRYIEAGDPYFNPNLDIMRETPTLRTKYE